MCPPKINFFFNFMKKLLVFAGFFLVLTGVVSSMTIGVFAGGDKVTGEKGQGDVTQNCVNGADLDGDGEPDCEFEGKWWYN